MFFRTKTIKNSRLLHLVESFRDAEGRPRQRVVVSLGDADLPLSETAAIARAVEGHLLGQPNLLEPELSGQAAGWVRRILQLAGRSKSARPVRARIPSMAWWWTRFPARTWWPTARNSSPLRSGMPSV